MLIIHNTIKSYAVFLSVLPIMFKRVDLSFEKLGQ